MSLKLNVIERGWASGTVLVLGVGGTILSKVGEGESLKIKSSGRGGG